MIGVVVSYDSEDKSGFIAPKRGRHNFYFRGEDCEGEVRQGSLVRFQMVPVKGRMEATNVEIVK